MSETSARFGLPFIVPGQAQKELYHNEALARVDGLLHSSVEQGPLADIPPQPEVGQCWIVGSGAAGDWAGHDHDLAIWTVAGWRFVAPLEGTCVWNKAARYWIYFSGVEWSDGEWPVRCLTVQGKQIVTGRQEQLLSPSGGTVIDMEARAGIAQIIETLMSHGLIE